jgi:cytochrome c551/c552
LKQRDQWLADLRRDAARWSGELEAQLLLAEAECRSGHGAECLAAARRAEAIAPTDSRVPMWKGLATVQVAAAAAPAERGPMLASARALIVKANQIDHDAVGPLMAYYASFVDVGETPSNAAIDGVQRAMEEVPNAPETRLTLATALTGRGQYDVARPVILPVAAGPYDTPEKPAAQALLARLGSATSTDAQPAGDPSGPSAGTGAEPAPPTEAKPGHY